MESGKSPSIPKHSHFLAKIQKLPRSHPTTSQTTVLDTVRANIRILLGGRDIRYDKGLEFEAQIAPASSYGRGDQRKKVLNGPKRTHSRMEGTLRRAVV
ncbi:hypothetical protein TNIN_21151 [Trichonephila inaurata madagascariensis]|uniref:Uncharacterized protein n=1 Tax=Trichonephila inaurata madagascariensis TaxID=2747483 RepID=A0A8X6YFX2_9ARAC|nr:hypothetical protein TNIN_21151 [Trichonephila inaurata madagascariensis]